MAIDTKALLEKARSIAKQADEAWVSPVEAGRVYAEDELEIIRQLSDDHTAEEGSETEFFYPTSEGKVTEAVYEEILAKQAKMEIKTFFELVEDEALDGDKFSFNSEAVLGELVRTYGADATYMAIEDLKDGKLEDELEGVQGRDVYAMAVTIAVTDAKDQGVFLGKLQEAEQKGYVGSAEVKSIYDQAVVDSQEGEAEAAENGSITSMASDETYVEERD